MGPSSVLEVVSMVEGNRTRGRRATVKGVEPRLDAKARNLGITAVPAGLVEDYVECSESPLERMAQHILETPSMHGKWLTVPVGNIGSVKAKATARKWARTIAIDGTPVKFRTATFKRDDTDKSYWGVAFRYDPDKQPKPKETAETVRRPEPPVPQPARRVSQQP